jgi:excinuclease UvrABC nuclease subunit
MQDAADRQDFESAAVFRDRLDALCTCLNGSRSNQAHSARDITAWPWMNGANIQCLSRGTQIGDRRSLTFVNVAEADAHEVIRAFHRRVLRGMSAVPGN